MYTDNSFGCGIAPSTLPQVHARITNGQASDISDWPWMVSIIDATGFLNGNRHSSGLKQHCGGAIITTSHIITAGHCVPEG